MNWGKGMGYLRQHWFKVIAGLLLLFLLMRKDLSFELNLRSPTRQDTFEEPKEPVPAQKRRPEEREAPEILTEREAENPGASAETPAQSERFDLLGREDKAARPSAPLKAIEKLDRIDEATKQAFIDRFDRVAVDERKRYGVPAAVILGNAMLLSQSGKSPAAQEGKNFFRLPCTPDWKGKSGIYRGDCLRHYDRAWTSFRDHSLFLTTGKYAHLKQLRNRAYTSWAQALEDNGFAQEAGYARQLIAVIERHRLYELDE